MNARNTKKATEEITHEDQLSERIADVLMEESDRGCVIFGAALLSDALQELLMGFFRQTPEDRKSSTQLFEGYAPLATFSARIQVAYALALLPRVMRDKIEIVRRLRNDFAHESGPLNFDDPRCASRLKPIIEGPDLSATMQRFVEGLRERQEAREIGHENGKDSGDSLELTATMHRRIAFAMFIAGTVTHIHASAESAKTGMDLRKFVLEAFEKDQGADRSSK